MKRGCLVVFLGVFLAACSGGAPVVGAPGTCAAPASITLPFTAPDTATTKDLVDATSLPCGMFSGIVEGVYGFSLDSARPVRVTANDSSGMGLALSIRSGSDCSGTSAHCAWQSNGIVDTMVPLQAGAHVVIIERIPAGKFTLTIE